MEEVSEVDPDKVAVVCTDSSETLDPRRVVAGEAWREELCPAVAVCEVLAVLLLQLGVHGPGHAPRPHRGHHQKGQPHQHQKLRGQVPEREHRHCATGIQCH